MRRRGVGRVGRPSLVGTMARTAVVAGTASAVAGGVSHHQQEKAMEQQEAAAYEQQQQACRRPGRRPQAQAASPAPAGGDDTVAQLQQLAQLKEQGILTEEEFAAQKARVLGG